MGKVSKYLRVLVSKGTGDEDRKGLCREEEWEKHQTKVLRRERVGHNSRSER